MTIQPDLYRVAAESLTVGVMHLGDAVRERDRYIAQLHRLIEVSVDMNQQPELAELMAEAPKMRSYES